MHARGGGRCRTRGSVCTECAATIRSYHVLADMALIVSRISSHPMGGEPAGDDAVMASRVCTIRVDQAEQALAKVPGSSICWIRLNGNDRALAPENSRAGTRNLLVGPYHSPAGRLIWARAAQDQRTASSAAGIKDQNARAQRQVIWSTISAPVTAPISPRISARMIIADPDQALLRREAGVVAELYCPVGLLDRRERGSVCLMILAHQRVVNQPIPRCTARLGSFLVL